MLIHGDDESVDADEWWPWRCHLDVMGTRVCFPRPPGVVARGLRVGSPCPDNNHACREDDDDDDDDNDHARMTMMQTIKTTDNPRQIARCHKSQRNFTFSSKCQQNSYMWLKGCLADIATATLSLPWPCTNTTSVWAFYRFTVAPGRRCLLPFYPFSVAPGHLFLLPFYRFTVLPSLLITSAFYRFTVLPFTGALPHRTTRKQKTYTTPAQAAEKVNKSNQMQKMRILLEECGSRTKSLSQLTTDRKWKSIPQLSWK